MSERSERDRDVEARLQSAIDARTSSVEPGPDGLRRIEEMIMTETTTDRRQRRWLIGLTSAAAVIAIVLALVVFQGDGDEETAPADTSSTTTSESTTTSTTEEPTTTTAFAPTVDPAQVVWPRVDTSQRFDDPVAAARSFAVDFVGFTDPVLGEFQQGDSRSGEVPIQPTATGPTTTVLVRLMEDDTWFVLASVTSDIALDTPGPGEAIDCPARLIGSARAFEGHVDVRIHADGVDDPIGTGFVTGASDSQAPFDGTVDCENATGAEHGAVVLTTVGGEDSRIWQAVVGRVALP